MNIKRKILAALCQFLAVAAVVLSFKPRIDLWLYEHTSGADGYAHGYWDYFVLRSWLIAFAGLAVALIFFWMSTALISQVKGTAARFSAGRLAMIVCSAVVAALVCANAPGLSNVFGKITWDDQVPMNIVPQPADRMAFLILTNEPDAPRIQYARPKTQTPSLLTNSFKLN